MTETSPRGLRSTRAVYRAAPLVVLTFVALISGCPREQQPPPTAQVISGSHVSLFAYLDAELPYQQDTRQLLRELEANAPERVRVRLIDIGTDEGRRLWQDAGLDAEAIAIDGNTTVSWGEGDSRRTVSFIHPPGFTWTANDLRDAVQAALRGELRSADPAEAEGVRIVTVTVRGQAIRVGNESAETGQLVMGDRTVLETTAPRGEQGPGQRVSAAAETLTRVLEKPFTPNQLTLEPAEDDGVALLAAGEQVIVATQADSGDEAITPRALAEGWRNAVREALVAAALQRPATPPTPEPAPTPDAPQSPDDVLHDPLAPPT